MSLGLVCAGGLPLLLDVQVAQVALGQVDELLSLPGQDGPGRIQREALDLAVGELGRQRELVAVGADIDQGRAVVLEGRFSQSGSSVPYPPACRVLTIYPGSLADGACVLSSMIWICRSLIRRAYAS